MIHFIIENGKIYREDADNNRTLHGCIGRIEYTLETLYEGTVYRLETVTIYDDNDSYVFNDDSIINNEEFHERQEVINELMSHYGVTQDILEES